MWAELVRIEEELQPLGMAVPKQDAGILLKLEYQLQVCLILSLLLNGAVDLLYVQVHDAPTRLALRSWFVCPKPSSTRAIQLACNSSVNAMRSLSIVEIARH